MSEQIEFQTLKNGEWHITRATGINGKHFHKCCDCGLVHEMKFRIFEIVDKTQPVHKLKRLNLKNLAIGMAFWRI